MILITGGAWQGKYGYALKLAGLLEREQERQESDAAADGRLDPYEAAYERLIIRGIHEYVRRILAEGNSPEEFINCIVKRNPDVIITSDEVGCGIVPVGKTERAWREACGRIQARLAAESSLVYRMVCGIPQRLK